MRAYVITTGVIFALITITHIMRMVVERRVLTEPDYILLTLLSAALTVWSFVVLRRLSR